MTDNVSEVGHRAMRKVVWRFLPILTIAYVLNYLDRTSVGFAALTMNRDIGINAYQFGWGAGLLFASYALFEIPSNMIGWTDLTPALIGLTIALSASLRLLMRSE